MSFNEGDSSSNSQQSQLQNIANMQNSSGSGSTATTPLNSAQIIGALNGAQWLNQATLPRAYDLAMQGQSQAGVGTGNAFNLANGSANDLTTKTLNGDFLSPGSNPYLDQTFNIGAGKLENASRSAWGGQDTIPGSSGVQQAALGNADASLASQIYGGNYQQERQNQLATLGQVPALGQAEMAPGMASLSAAYQPLQQYISALSSLSPGSVSNMTKNVTQTGSSAGSSSGSGQTNGSTKSSGLNLL